MTNSRPTPNPHGTWHTKLRSGAGLEIVDPATGQAVALLRLTLEPATECDLAIRGHFLWRRLSVDAMADRWQNQPSGGQDGAQG